jgi:2-C-methyl-D-erythritol 4-phosphate cytidylyltransferase/2-C-methyl-D-erythritol 2,4-cyclodiphosphate synthase
VVAVSSGAVFVVVVAAGGSSRMGGEKKEFLSLGATETVLSRSLAVLLKFNPARTVVALPRDNFEMYEAKAKNLPGFPDAGIDFVPGGNTRRESVLNALLFLDSRAGESEKNNAVVLIHDGARPWIDEALVGRVIDSARRFGAAAPAISPVDTLKEKGADGFVSRHPARDSLAAVQTPQGFWFSPLLAAHRSADTVSRTGKTYTDDTEIWDEFSDRRCVLVEGSPENIKITYPSDLHPLCETATNSLRDCFRIGIGNDTHPLVPNRKLVLGGVHIPFDKGEAGHSDGDALLHAIIDALLGAAALGDVGSFFPPDEPAYKDADSRGLLGAAWKAVCAAGWRLENLDCVIELEAPRFLPFRDAVRDSIADILGVPAARVFVKAKTGEKMGEVGRGEAVKAWATCLLSRP